MRFGVALHHEYTLVVVASAFSADTKGPGLGRPMMQTLPNGRWKGNGAGT